jgi:GPH family glycoside/pentoside/hexuronide:cation symporter
MNDKNTINLDRTAAGEAGAEKLTNAVIWAYAAPGIGFRMMGFLFGTYLMKFATDVLLIAPAAMGALIAASRLWDAVSDPLVGYLSDRTQSRFGRRRVWLYCSAIPMALGMVMMWSPPSVLEGIQLIAWMALALWIYETASTAFFVPHGALGVELTPNFHERTRMYGYTHMIGAIGSMLGLGFLYLMNSAEDERAMAFVLSMIAGISVMGLVIGSTRVLPERSEFQGRGAANPFRSFTDVFRNPHALLLLIVFGIETFGAATIGLLVPYMVDYVLPADQLPLSKAVYFPAILATYTIPQFVFAPLWIRLARLVGKKTLWAASMWLTAATFIGFYFSLDKPILIWILSFLLGLTAGIGAVVAPSIKADIIDYDEYLTGERKEGTYLAVWNLIRKGAASMTALITGVILQLFDFVPNAEQSADTQYALRVLFSLLPAACYIVGGIIFIRFSLNEAEHLRVREEISSRGEFQRSP